MTIKHHTSTAWHVTMAHASHLPAYCVITAGFLFTMDASTSTATQLCCSIVVAFVLPFCAVYVMYVMISCDVMMCSHSVS